MAPPQGLTRVVVNTEVIEKGQHLNGECLVDLDQADVVDRQAGLTKHCSVAGIGPTPMTSGSTPAKE